MAPTRRNVEPVKQLCPAMSLFLLSACTGNSGHAATHPPDSCASRKVAEIGNETVALEEVDAALGRSLYDNRAFVLRGALLTALLNTEAKRRGVQVQTILDSYNS